MSVSAPSVSPARVGDVTNHAAVFYALLDLTEGLGVEESVPLVRDPAARRAERAREARAHVGPVYSASAQARVSEVSVSQSPTTDVRRKRGVIHAAARLSLG